ncbi:MAG: hypothetical protein GY835_18735 [bacterium]|nr:hypothetical protein [bacterium]
MSLQGVSTPSHGNQSIPGWVQALKGRFYRPDEAPEPVNEWDGVSVNGTLFKKNGGAWHAERGRHGRLTEDGEEFIYTAKDGTRYYYDAPRWEEKDPEDVVTPVYMHAGDGLITSAELDPGNLIVGTETIQRKPVTPMPGPTYVKRIVDRNDNEITFTYNGVGQLETVTDAVGWEPGGYNHQQLRQFRSSG